jgi:PPP family 3-phenylpropionic acid transporter
MRLRGLGVTLIMSCFFCAAGVVMPFLPQWLASERGLAGAQIGLVVSAAQLARVAIGPLIAAWADGFADRRTPLRLLSLGAFVSYLAFFNAHPFVLLLILGFCALVFTAAATPLVEGAALRSARNGGISFGTSRAIGSSAFILGSVASGALVSRFGVGLAPVYILTILAGAVAAALFALSPDPAPSSQSGFRRRLKQALPLLRNRKFALALLATGLTQSAHGFFYAFSTLVWSRQGFDAGTIGALWATGVACEVVFLLMLRHTEKVLSAETMVLIGSGVSVLRWGAMAFAPPLFVVLPLQILHAGTFAATHVGALRIVERETSPEAAGLGMTLYAIAVAGTPLGLVTILSGVLFDRVGAGGYAAMAALAAAGFFAAIAMARAGSEYPPVRAS